MVVAILGRNKVGTDLGCVLVADIDAFFVSSLLALCLSGKEVGGVAVGF